MWYLRDVLVLPDVRLAQMQSKWEEEDSAREAKEKKKEGGFFRRLFKKKEKKEEVAPSDTLQVEPPEERSEFDFEYNENEPVQDTVTQAEPAKKKGFFSFLKKDKKRDRTKEAKTSDGPASDQPKQRKERKQKAPKKEEPSDVKPLDEEVEGDEGF
jgi:hypothetical protein